MGIMVRKKRLFEDGQPNGNQQQAQQTNAPAQDNQNQQEQQQSSQNQQQANTPQQTTPVNNQKQINNQKQTQQTSQKQSPAAELNAKVQNCVNFFTETVSKNDPFALMMMNVPDKIKEMVPEFKNDNPQAKDAIAAWEKFKAQPSKDNWDSFINQFVAFGNSGLEAEKKQVNPQPATTPQAEQAVQQNKTEESLNFDFARRLNERIELKRNIGKICRSIENNYLDD